MCGLQTGTCLVYQIERHWEEVEREGEGLLSGRLDDFLLGVFENPLCSSVFVGEH